MTALARLAARARLLTWLAWWTLLLQQALDAFLHGAPWIIWLAKLLPLLLFAPGMRADNLRSYIWLAFVSLGYFMILVQRIFAAPTDPLVIVGLAADVVLFISAMLFIRWRARALREAASLGHGSDGH
ncbi:MAG: DUF2069 domain-containing protein [Halioglobus sp.]|nr:DUF2069 domain-containing protein [Halioglobus sp.]